MTPTRKRNVRKPSDADLKLLLSLLGELPTGSRMAFNRYYVDGATAEQAIEGSSMSLEQFRELRAGMRGRFFARTRRLAS